MSVSMLLLFAAASASSTYQGELLEHLRTEPVASLSSAKQSYDLEICIADVLTILGTPTVFRNGPEDVVVAASFTATNAYLASATIIRIPQGSKIDLRVRGKGWNDRLRSRIEACL